MLIKSPELAKTRQIRQFFRAQAQTPILNFVEVLVECIELGEFELVKQMADVDYAAELRRDPSLYDKVDTICQKYFQQPIRKANGMQAML